MVTIPPVNIRIVKDDRPKKVRNIKTSYSQVIVGAGLGPQLVLAHTPNRISAYIQCTNNPCWFGVDQSAAKRMDNATANIQPTASGFYVMTTGELWAYSAGANCNISIIQEFENKGE